MKKDKLFLVLYIIFAILTFGSAIYVIITKTNSGGSVLFMSVSMVFSNLYNREKRK